MKSSFKKVLGSLSALVLAVVLTAPASAEGPSFSGFVDATYNYNFNGLDTNAFRAFDGNSNTFNLQNFELVTQGKEGDVSYRADVYFGQDASVINYANANAGSQVELQQAFLSVPCPLTGGVFTAGKFATPFGAEVNEAKDNFNTSRGFLFFYAIPIAHTGLKYDKSFGDLGLTLGVVNGWDNNTESNPAAASATNGNSGKTGLLQVAKPFGDKIKVILGGAYGPEQAEVFTSTTPGANVNQNGRSLVDAVVTFNPSDKFSFIFNADWGVEEGLAPSGTDTTQNWAGVGLHGKYAFSENLSLALRFENFDDEGSRTLVAGGAVLNSLTATLEKKMGGVISRLEVRQDSSNKKVFVDSDGLPDDSQTTLGLQWIYAF